MAEKTDAAWPEGAGQSGSDSENNPTTIIQQYDEAGTAVALFAHSLLHLASETHDANLVRLALHVVRIAVEIHAVGQVLPAAVLLATVPTEAAA
jgi:hypothetical protein